MKRSRKRTEQKRISLRRRFIILYLSLVLLPVLVLSLVFTVTSFRYLKEAVRYSQKSSFQQTAQLLEYYVSNVNDNANALLGTEEFHKIVEKDNSNESRQEQIRDMLTLRKLLGNCSSKKEVSDVYLYIDNEALYIGENSQVRKLSDVTEESWYGYVEESYPDSVMIPSEYLKKEYVVGYAKAIRSARNYSKTVGIVFFELNKTLLTSYLGTAGSAQIFIMNQRGEIIAQNKEDCELISAEEIIRYADGESHTVRKGNKSYYLYADSLEKTDWYLVCLEPSEIMGKMLWQQGTEYLIVFLVILFMGLIFFWLFFRYCLNRISAMTKHISGIRKQLPQPMEAGTGGDEIDELILAYNYMLERVNGLLKEQYELGNQIKEIEMKALYEQINPHFLYNTLTMINWLAEDGQIEDVTKVITALSSFYRLSLNKGNENIFLREELEIARNFVYIQQMRFGTDIRLECDIDPVYEQFILPKLTLQPLVENALVHGILKRKDKCGMISVSVSDRDGVLLIRIADTGVGMDEETVQRMNNGTLQSNGKHYGVWNVVQRASLYFNAPCSIFCSSKEGEGTVMELSLPYREG